jgi:hypothetical protein
MIVLLHLKNLGYSSVKRYLLTTASDVGRPILEIIDKGDDDFVSSRGTSKCVMSAPKFCG